MTAERVQRVAPQLAPPKLEISAPTQVRRDRDAVKAMLAKAGIDAADVYKDEQPSSTTTTNEDAMPVSPRLAISKPTGVRKDRDAVKKMLAAAGIDASTVYGDDDAQQEQQQQPSTSSPPLSPRSLAISKPMEFKKDRAAVEALLAQAGIDAKSVLPKLDADGDVVEEPRAGSYGTWTGR
jgi:uncharacterized protein Smg (DUF494 family)